MIGYKVRQLALGATLSLPNILLASVVRLCISVVFPFCSTRRTTLRGPTVVVE